MRNVKCTKAGPYIAEGGGGGGSGAAAPARKTKFLFSNIVSEFAELFLVAILA